MTSATKDHAEDYLADLQQALADLALTIIHRVREALAAARDCTAVVPPTCSWQPAPPYTAKSKG